MAANSIHIDKFHKAVCLKLGNIWGRYLSSEKKKNIGIRMYICFINGTGLGNVVKHIIHIISNAIFFVLDMMNIEQARTTVIIFKM